MNESSHKDSFDLFIFFCGWMLILMSFVVASLQLEARAQSDEIVWKADHKFDVPFDSITRETEGFRLNLNLGIRFQNYGDPNRSTTFLKAASLQAITLPGMLLPDLAIAKIYMDNGAYGTAQGILAATHESAERAGNSEFQNLSLIMMADNAVSNFDLNTLRLSSDSMMKLNSDKAQERSSFRVLDMKQVSATYLAILSKFNGNPKLLNDLLELQKRAKESKDFEPSQLTEVDNLIKSSGRDQWEASEKSPALATGLSVLAPGLGHIYVGEYVHGAVAFIATASICSLSRWAWLRQEKSFAVFAGVGCLLTYGGSAAGAGSLANVYNSRKMKELQKDFAETYKPQISVSLGPEGISLTWHFSPKKK
jgi:hypothetical protein